MPESVGAWRLSVVLRDLQYPAQKWMIETVADLYGADVHTRIELQDLPEVTYYNIGEVVAAVENRASRSVATPVPPQAQCCGRRM